ARRWSTSEGAPASDTTRANLTMTSIPSSGTAAPILGEDRRWGDAVRRRARALGGAGSSRSVGALDHARPTRDRRPERLPYPPLDARRSMSAPLTLRSNRRPMSEHRKYMSIL